MLLIWSKMAGSPPELRYFFFFSDGVHTTTCCLLTTYTKYDSPIAHENSNLMITCGIPGLTAETDYTTETWFVKISSKGWAINMAIDYRLFWGLLISHSNISLSPCSSHYSWKKLTIAIRLCVNIPITEYGWIISKSCINKERYGILLTILHEHKIIEKLIFPHLGRLQCNSCT